MMPIAKAYDRYGETPSNLAPRSPEAVATRATSLTDMRASPPGQSFSTFNRASSVKEIQKGGFDALPPFIVKPKEEITPSDLHPVLVKAQWKRFYDCLTFLEGQPKEIRRAFLTRNAAGETPLHVAAWKAPPRLVLKMVEMIPLDDRKEYLLTVEEDGNTPLHLACANLDDRMEFSVIKNVLLLAPEAVEVRNRNGDTPLHLLVASQGFRKSTDFTVEAAAEEAISSLLHMVGHLATVQNKQGLTLLHVALGHGTHERVLVQLLNMAPEAARMKDFRGMLPLHYVAALGGGTPWTFVGQLIWAYPESIVECTLQGDTPLHLLMSNANKHLKKDQFVDRNTTKLAELLVGSGSIDVSPLMVQNKEHLSPLHGCALFDTPPQLTRLLMESSLSKAASALTTEFGATALHLACASSKVADSVANVECLATREACAVTDSNERTPLVVAVQNRKASSAVVKALVAAYPEAAAQMSTRGFLPLHLALQGRKVKDSIVKALLKANPDSVKITTPSGNTALHEACFYGASPAVIRMLLQRYPEAASVTNMYGEIPLDRAMASDAPDAVLRMLEGKHDANFQRASIQRLDSSYSESYSESFSESFSFPESCRAEL